MGKQHFLSQHRGKCILCFLEAKHEEKLKKIFYFFYDQVKIKFAHFWAQKKIERKNNELLNFIFGKRKIFAIFSKKN